MEILKKRKIKLVPEEYYEDYYKTRDGEVFELEEEAISHEEMLNDKEEFLSSISYSENPLLYSIMPNITKIFKFTNNVDFSLLCSWLDIDGMAVNENGDLLNPITDLVDDEEYVCICGEVQVRESNDNFNSTKYMRFIPYENYKKIVLL